MCCLSKCLDKPSAAQELKSEGSALQLTFSLFGGRRVVYLYPSLWRLSKANGGADKSRSKAPLLYASIAVEREWKREPYFRSPKLWPCYSHCRLMRHWWALGFGNPFLYANQAQLASAQCWCGRRWHVSSALSVSAKLQLRRCREQNGRL